MHTQLSGVLLHALTAVALFGTALGCGAAGKGADQDQMKAIQEELNAQTLSKPFETADPKDLEAYLDNAVKQGIKPPMRPGSHWRPGYTCGNLLSWYPEYVNCLHYYRYYRCYYCL